MKSLSAYLPWLNLIDAEKCGDIWLLGNMCAVVSIAPSVGSLADDPAIGNSVKGHALIPRTRGKANYRSVYYPLASISLLSWTHANFHLLVEVVQRSSRLGAIFLGQSLSRHKQFAYFLELKTRITNFHLVSVTNANSPVSPAGNRDHLHNRSQDLEARSWRSWTPPFDLQNGKPGAVEQTRWQLFSLW